MPLTRTNLLKARGESSLASTCREGSRNSNRTAQADVWREKDASLCLLELEQRARRWSRSRLGRAGDEARELLPWTAGPGAQKNFDAEHPLARDSKGRSLALVLYLIQPVWCPPSLPLCITHPLPVPRGPSRPHALLNLTVNYHRKRGFSYGVDIPGLLKSGGACAS